MCVRVIYSRSFVYSVFGKVWFVMGLKSSVIGLMLLVIIANLTGCFQVWKFVFFMFPESLLVILLFVSTEYVSFEWY